MSLIINGEQGVQLGPNKKLDLWVILFCRYFAIVIEVNNPTDQAELKCVERLKEKRMFTGISWTDYMVAVAIGLTLYYCYVAFRYYSEELKGLISGKGKLNFRTPIAEPYQSEELNSPPSGSSSFEQTRDDDFAEVEEFIAKIKSAVADASKKKYVTQEFKHSLRLIFREYPNIKNSPIRSSINELLVSECEKHGTVALSEEEADRLWLETV